MSDPNTNTNTIEVSTSQEPIVPPPPAVGTEAEATESGAVTETSDTGTSAEATDSTKKRKKSAKAKALKAPKEAKEAKASKAPKDKAPKDKAPKGGKGSKGAKDKAKKERADKPSTGQSAEEFQLPYGNLNPKEKKVIDFLDNTGHGTREIKTIDEIAEECFHGKSDSKNVTSSGKRANSWARNSLRDLIPGGFAEKVERGQYRITEAGRKRRERALESEAE